MKTMLLDMECDVCRGLYSFSIKLKLFRAHDFPHWDRLNQTRDRSSLR